MFMTNFDFVRMVHCEFISKVNNGAIPKTSFNCVVLDHDGFIPNMHMDTMWEIGIAIMPNIRCDCVMERRFD